MHSVGVGLAVAERFMLNLDLVSLLISPGIIFGCIPMLTRLRCDRYRADWSELRVLGIEK